MALLRGLGIQCRFHGFTIEQRLQKGAIPTYVFWLAPKYIIHSWIEVYFKDRWINLEGFILDEQYLSSLQHKFSQIKKRILWLWCCNKVFLFARYRLAWSRYLYTKRRYS